MLQLKKPNKELIVQKTKDVIQKIGKRNLAIILAVLVIGGTVWLNIALFTGAKGDNNGNGGADTDASAGGATLVDGNENSSASDSYFASAQVERKRSRDEAIEVLQLVVDNPDALEESKAEAMKEISQIATDIDNESKIESLVVAKGFEKCVAVISGNKCNVIVKASETLLPNQVAQIFEIVYEQAGILPDDVKLIEKAD